MPLTLHAGAKEVTYDAVCAVAMPAATDSHIPVAHHEIVEQVRFALAYHKHEITKEQHALTEDGRRYFGVLTLRSPYHDYTDVVGLRNSHDKAFAIGLAYGSSVFVCDNLSFLGDHVIRRKHTAKAKRELPGLLNEIIAPLQAKRLEQNVKFARYQATRISDLEADHAIVDMHRTGLVGAYGMGAIVHLWDHPDRDYGDKTGWRLFNAATSVLASKIIEQPKLTGALHEIVDRTCELERWPTEDSDDGDDH